MVSDVSESKQKYVTVFIPTLNGEQFIKEIIDAILDQVLPDGYLLELLIIDSGSKDRTLEIIDDYKGKLTLDQIPNIEFSHGGTRDKAARMAKGEFILFLTQDATPGSKRWLINMLEPFFLSEQVGCVFGKQVPRPNAAPTIKREVSGVFGGFGPQDAILIYQNKSFIDHKAIYPINNFFSDVNSAVRRKLLVGEVPFRKVNYAEDHALAEDMQKKGYLKAYSPSGFVWHSNEYTPRQYFGRKFDEFIGLQESVGAKLTASKKSLLLGWIRPTVHDWKFIRIDKDYSMRSKLVWFIESPFYNMAAKAGQYYAARYLNSPKGRSKLSYENKIRPKNEG